MQKETHNAEVSASFVLLPIEYHVDIWQAPPQ